MVFTPGTVRRLLPFTLTLLQGAGVHLRLVSNGCDPSEIDVLRDTAAANARISHHELRSAGTVQHGTALNQLFEGFPDEPYFAVADSDVIAAGDFMPALWPMAADRAGVFSGTPVWAAGSDLVVPDDWPVLSGRMNVLADGTHVGSTYLAIYRRAAVEPSWRRAPRGFEVHFRHNVPRAIRSELAARGWDYRIFDTCRLVNQLLLKEGGSLENRVVPQLHHVGGLSAPSLPRRLRPLAGYAAFRLMLRRRLREPRHRRAMERRSLTSAYVGAVLTATEAGEPVPPPPATGSAEVDERLAALVGTIEARYRPLPPG